VKTQLRTAVLLPVLLRAQPHLRRIVAAARLAAPNGRCPPAWCRRSSCKPFGWRYLPRRCISLAAPARETVAGEGWTFYRALNTLLFCLLLTGRYPIREQLTNDVGRLYARATTPIYTVERVADYATYWWLTCWLPTDATRCAGNINWFQRISTTASLCLQLRYQPRAQDSTLAGCRWTYTATDTFLRTKHLAACYFGSAHCRCRTVGAGFHRLSPPATPPAPCYTAFILDNTLAALRLCPYV